MKQFGIDNDLNGIKFSDLKGFNHPRLEDIDSDIFMIESNDLILFTLGLLVFFLFLLENYSGHVGYDSFSHKLGLDYRNRINILLSLYKSNSMFLERLSGKGDSSLFTATTL